MRFTFDLSSKENGTIRLKRKYKNYMHTAQIKYISNLRVKSTHVKSNTTLVTDAPTDNNGKGEAFSPTDLVATALANCMLTVMAIKANSWGKDLSDTSATVTKHMGSGPRRIIKIDIELQLKNTFTKEEKETLEQVANACPVAKSLHSDIIQNISIVWN